MRHILLMAGMLAITLLQGCAATGDAHTASTGEIIFNKGKIEEGLNKKREYLNLLNAQVSALDDQLLTSKAELFKVQIQLKKSEIPKTQLEALQQEINMMEKQQAELDKDINSRKQEIVDISSSINEANADNAKLADDIVAVKGRVDNMDQKLKLVNEGIKRTAALRLQYSASSE